VEATGVYLLKILAWFNSDWAPLYVTEASFICPQVADAADRLETGQTVLV